MTNIEAVVTTGITSLAMGPTTGGAHGQPSNPPHSVDTDSHYICTPQLHVPVSFPGFISGLHSPVSLLGGQPCTMVFSGISPSPGRYHLDEHDIQPISG